MTQKTSWVIPWVYPFRMNRLQRWDLCPPWAENEEKNIEEKREKHKKIESQERPETTIENNYLKNE